MRKFGFIIHSTDLGLMRQAFDEPAFLTKDRRLIEGAFRWFPPFKCSHISGLETPGGERSEGILVFCTLLPDQILNLDQEFILNKTIEACKICQEYGAKIIGLGAYMAQVGRKGILVARESGVPITTGSCYTIAVSIMATLDAVKSVGMDINESSVAIIGASGKIGSICAEVLSLNSRRVFLVARNVERLNKLYLELKCKIKKSGKNCELIVTNDIKYAVGNSKVIMVVTTTDECLFETDDFLPGAVVCDISQPRNIPLHISNERKDVLIFDGGIVKLPGEVKFNFFFGLPEGLAYACMAETMILSLAELYCNYSIGANVSLMKVCKIWALASRYGFGLASLKNFGREISREYVDAIRMVNTANPISL